MVKIMAVFEDGHPDALVDLVKDGDEYDVLERFREYAWGNPANPEGYINFYSEQI